MNCRDIYGDKVNMNPFMPAKVTTVKEIDQMIEDLNRAIEPPAVVGEENIDEQKIIHLDLPAGVWQTFVEYCKENELDPSQMIREAVASHYLDLLQTLRCRTLIDRADKQDAI